MTQFQAFWPDGVSARWRELNWGEHRRFSSSSERATALNLQIYRAVLLQGLPAELAPAGVVSFVARHALTETAFTSTRAPITRALVAARQKIAGNYLESAMAIVSALFHIPFAEMDSWTPDTLFRYIARAESVSGRPLDPPAPVKNKKGKPAKSHEEGAHTFTKKGRSSTAAEDVETKARKNVRPLTPSQQIAMERTAQRNGAR